MGYSSFYNQQPFLADNNSNGYLNNAPRLETSSTFQRNTMSIDFAAQGNNQVDECRFFHYIPDDNMFYHVICKIISKGSVLLDDHDYDHGFFYDNSAANYFVTCKLFSHFWIANILNRKFYDADLGINNLKPNESLSLNHKFNLEQDLKRILPFHFIHFSHPRMMTSIQPFNQRIQMNECRLFHYAPDHNKFYHIICKIILQGTDPLDDHDYDHGFFYQYPNDSVANYVTCQLFSHFWIVNMLNRKIYCMDLDINNLKQKGSLSLNQKFNLEQDLKRILPNHIFNMNSFHGYNNIMTTQAASIIDNQSNFDNRLSQQNGVGGYAYHVAHTQQQDDFNNTTRHTPEKDIRLDDTNSFHGNIRNDTATVSVIGNGQNGVGDYNNNAPQQADFDDPQARPDCNVNTNSFNENIENNITTVQAVTTTDINQNYNENDFPCNDYQNVNGIEDYTHIAYLQQQVNLNDISRHGPDYDENIQSLNENAEDGSMTDNQNCDDDDLEGSQS